MRQRDFGSRRVLCAVLAAVVAAAAGSVRGDVVVDGAVTPGDYTTWTSSTSVFVGNSGLGSVVVNGGNGVISRSFGAGIGTTSASGTVTVDGVGSSWTMEGFSVGAAGTGVLSVTGGGEITTNNGADVGAGGAGSGSMTVDGNGSVCTIGGGFVVGANNGSGALMIKNQGVVTVNGAFLGGLNQGSTGNVVVDGGVLNETQYISNNMDFCVGNQGNGALKVVHGGTVNASGNCFIAFYHGTAGNVLVDGAGSGWSSRNLQVGGYGLGSLTLTNGGLVNVVSGVSVAAIDSGAVGVLVIDGEGSTLNAGGALYVGSSGNGTLKIGHGGAFNCSASSFLGYWVGSRGTVTVDGGSATWVNGALDLGSNGKGFLNILNGSSVAVQALTIHSTSQVNMKVGDGSALNCGGGALGNGGTLRLTAAVGATAGTYMPIIAGSWTGTGKLQVYGGKWDTSSHEFTVSEAAAGVPGNGVTIDRSAQQRVVITDATTLDFVQAGFQATAGSSNLTFTATQLTDAQKTALLGVVPVGQGVLDGWAFSADWPIVNHQVMSEPVSLSFKVGGGQVTENLTVWRYSGSTWAKFGADDLTYDGTYASFTVTSLSGYAVTGVVPEASTIGVLLVGVVGVVGRRRKRTEDTTKC